MREFPERLEIVAQRPIAKPAIVPILRKRCLQGAFSDLRRNEGQWNSTLTARRDERIDTVQQELSRP